MLLCKKQASKIQKRYWLKAAHHDHDGDGILDKEELLVRRALLLRQKSSKNKSKKRLKQKSNNDLSPKKLISTNSLTKQLNSFDKVKQRKHLHYSSHISKTIGAQHAGAWRIAGGAMARMDLDTHAIAALEHATKLDEGVASGWYNLGNIVCEKWKRIWC